MSKRTHKINVRPLNIDAIKAAITEAEIKSHHAVADVNDWSAKLSAAKIEEGRRAAHLDDLRRLATYYPGTNAPADQIDGAEAALAGARRDVELTAEHMDKALDKWRMLQSYVNGMNAVLWAGSI